MQPIAELSEIVSIRCTKFVLHSLRPINTPDFKKAWRVLYYSTILENSKRLEAIVSLERSGLS